MGSAADKYGWHELGVGKAAGSNGRGDPSGLFQASLYGEAGPIAGAVKARPRLIASEKKMEETKSQMQTLRAISNMWFSWHATCSSGR